MADVIGQAPGEKVARALKELSELVTANPDKKRAELLQRVIIKHDLSPKEAVFLENNFNE